MVRFSKILLYIVLAFIILWILPWAYSFMAPQSLKLPFSLYSPILEDFVTIHQDKERGPVRMDGAGNEYTQSEADSLLPFFYARQLVADGRFPDSVNHVAVTPYSAQMNSVMFRAAAYELHKNKIELYPLLESMSGRVELEMPDDVFRMTDKGLQFIDMESNTVNITKSHMFNQLMQNKGFVFPAQLISGNPTPKKEYDEGYLMTDATGELFHVKQMVKRPYCRHIVKPDSLQIKRMFLTENRNHVTLAYLVSEENELYILNKDGYQFFNTHIPYNEENQDITIIGNQLDWTVRVVTDDAVHYYAIDAFDYHIIKETQFPIHYKSLWGLHFLSGNDSYVLPRFY